MLRTPKGTPEEKPEELRKRCICLRCPSYAECVRDEKQLLFCIEGKARCSLEKYGCICGDCPVHKSKGFSDYYYCITGKAKK